MELKKIDDFRWELPRQGSMRVPGKVFASSAMLKGGKQAEPLKQVSNVATLPGIVKASMAMPDMHWGYGFPIGGVAAFDWQSGIISPGGVGYDINCGVRLATSALDEKDDETNEQNETSQAGHGEHEQPALEVKETNRVSKDSINKNGKKKPSILPCSDRRFTLSS